MNVIFIVYLNFCICLNFELLINMYIAYNYKMNCTFLQNNNKSKPMLNETQILARWNSSAKTGYMEKDHPILVRPHQHGGEILPGGMNFSHINHCTKMKFSIKVFFSKCDQIRSFLQILSHLLKKSLMESFCAECSFEKVELITSLRFHSGEIFD